jgi:hypothetical protein
LGISVILATQEAEIRSIKVQGQRGQKVGETPSQKISWKWWFPAVILSVWEVQVGGLQCEPVLGRNRRLPLKNN